MRTGTIGRFRVEVTTLGKDDRLYVSFAIIEEDGTVGPVFGEISLEAACMTPVVDLYESAEYRLGLGLMPAADISKYCLDHDEIEELHKWATAVSEEIAGESVSEDLSEPSTSDIVIGAVAVAAVAAALVGAGVLVVRLLRRLPLC